MNRQFNESCVSLKTDSSVVSDQAPKAWVLMGQELKIVP